jgi:hypothetical protein
MPIVSGNQSADIKIQIAAEMDKASAKAVQDAVAKMSEAGRKATEAEIRAERELKAVEDARAKSLQAASTQQAAASKAQLDAQNKYRAGLMKTREEAEKLQQISQKALMAGGAILAPFIASVAKFTAAAAKSDPVAQQYRASMKSLEESTNKIGRTTTDILNPALKVTAEIMADIARTVESNPALVQGALGVGGGLVALGTIGTVVAQVKMITSTLALLTGVGGAVAGAEVAGGAVAGSGIAAIATAAAPVVITALLAAGIIAIAMTAAKNAPDLAPEQKAAFGSGSGFVKGKWGNDFSMRNYGAVYGPPDTRQPYGPPRPGYGQYGGLIGPKQPTESENAIAQAVEDRLEAEKESAKKRLELTKQFESKRADIEKSMAETTRSFLNADRQAHQDYYNQRSDIARTAGIEASRAEEDHQKNIAKIQRDSDNKIFGMVQERDALGIVQEKRNAEVQRQDTEEQYRTEVARRNQDMAERLRIMDREFALTNERRLAEYNYTISLKSAEVTAAQMAFDAITAGAANMVANVNALMSGLGTREPPPGTRKPGERYDTGGNVRRTGSAIVDAGELIVSRSNRQMAENLIGGNLTQSNLLDALRGGGGSRATINNNFGGTVTISQVAQMLDMSAKSIMQQINRSIQAA